MRLLLAFILLCSTALAEYVPSGTHTWYNADVDSTRKHGGGPPYNYLDPSDGAWKATDLTWIVKNGNLINITNNHRSRINGTTNIAEYEFGGHIIKQRAFGLFAYRRSTHQRIMLDNTPDFSNRTFVDSIVTYTDIFPDVDLKIYVRLDAMAFKWVFHQAARDAFDTWWTNNGSLADIYLVTAFRFDISSMGDMTMHDKDGQFNLTIDRDLELPISFKSSGRHSFYLSDQKLDQWIWESPAQDSIIQFPIYTRAVKIGGTQYLLEGIKWTDAKQIPPGDISHHDTFGNTAQETTSAHIGDRQRILLARPSATGTTNSITAFFSAVHASNVKYAIYSADGLTFIDSTVPATPPGVGWFEQATVEGATVTSGTDYLIAGWGSINTNILVSDAFAGFTRYTNTGQTYGIWPSTIGKNNANTDEAISIYVTFTISGGGPAPSTRRRKVLLGLQ